MRPKFSAALLSCASALACSCSGPADLPLPPGFLLGVATAGFQNDPGCPSPALQAECTDRRSDWYDFVTSPEIVNDPATFVKGEALENAPGSYEIFPADFDLVRDRLRGNAVRLSLEWSRLFPDESGRPDPRAVAHYHEVFAALKARGLQPLVTLHHYTLPSWLHDAVGCHKDLKGCKRRGWLDRPKILAEIARYAAFAAGEFGAEVDLWATLNEPFAVVVPGFLLPTKDRSNPPAASLAFEEARAAMVSMIYAHARMFDAVRAMDKVDADSDGKAARVGLVYNLTPAAPRDPENPLDVQGAKNVFYLYNEVFLNATIRGDLDERMDGSIVHHDELAGRMDFLGVNYYTQVLVDGTAQPTLGQLSPKSTFNPLTLTIWSEHPRGLYDMIRLVNGYGVPVIVTENGTASQDDPEAAPRYLVQHLSEVARARAEGAQVEGYFYWTLVDNYEWNHGMDMRFGLFSLSQGARTKTRTARPAADVYRQIAEAGAIPAALRARYPQGDRQ
jgi:beta-glucosidase/6-phospho-beta-glucosidase/beta-galactosidase